MDTGGYFTASKVRTVEVGSCDVLESQRGAGRD